jgi:hypothetical protein
MDDAPSDTSSRDVTVRPPMIEESVGDELKAAVLRPRRYGTARRVYNAEIARILGKGDELRGPKPLDREGERRQIYQAVANILGRHQHVSRGRLAVKLALTPDGFDDKRKRCDLKLNEIQHLTLDQLAFKGIYPEIDPNR